MLYPSEQANKFVILFTDRSGSTWLVNTLASHKEIRAEQEKLDGRKDQGFDAQAQWIVQFFTLPKKVPYKAVGFKTKLSDIADPDEFAHLLQSLDVRIIHLERRNLVRQTISWLNADRLHQTARDWNVYRKAVKLPPIQVELDEFDRRLKQLARGTRRLERFVSALPLPTLHLTYEDLFLDFKRTIARVLDYLDVPSRRLRSRVKKATNDDLRQAVANLSELKARYLGTLYEPMFDKGFGNPHVKPKSETWSAAKPHSHRLLPREYVQCVIIGGGRSGSTFLQLLLSSHTKALSFGEILGEQVQDRRHTFNLERPINPEEDPVVYINNHIYKRDMGDLKAVSFRLFYPHARNNGWESVWEALASPHIQVIHLKRRNVLDRYLSMQLGFSSGRWMAYGDEPPPPYPPITLNPADCFEFFHRSVYWQEWADKWFKDNPKLEVTYEDLCADLPGECARIQAFLGVEQQALVAQTRKQRTQTQSELIANYDELKETLVDWIAHGWARQEWLDFFCSGTTQ